MLLADELVERARPHPQRQRGDLLHALAGGVGEEVTHAESMLRAVSVEDFTKPILAGEGASDYERYLRTDELLSLQRGPEERLTATSCSSRRFIRRRSCG